MADKFHIRENGEPGKCDATVRDCPLGDESRHYASPEDARVAYEVIQMAHTLPGGISMSEETRQRLNLPSVNHPAFSGVPRQRSLAEVVESARKTGRATFEEKVGGRTYAVNMRNERYMPRGSTGVHIIEADAPWNEQQKEAFQKFIDDYGFEYEERKSRVSIFKTFPSPEPAPEQEMVGDYLKANIETSVDLDGFDPSTQTAFSRPAARKNPKDAVRSIESMRDRFKGARGPEKEAFEAKLEAQTREVEYLCRVNEAYRTILEENHRGLAHYLIVRSFQS